MLAPNEEPWVNKFLPQKPQLTLRCSGGMGDAATLYANGGLVAAGTADALTDRAPAEFGLQVGDVVILELVQANKRVMARLRSRAERESGVRVCVDVQPLSEGSDSA